MRKALILAAILWGGLLAAGAAWAIPPLAGGTVTVVDAAARTFTCHWQPGDVGFRTSDKTTFWLGKQKGSMDDLKVGSEVTVTYHVDGADKVADKVQIRAAKTAPAAKSS